MSFGGFFQLKDKMDQDSQGESLFQTQLNQYQLFCQVHLYFIPNFYLFYQYSMFCSSYIYVHVSQNQIS